ncbi:hypothetical protein E6W36_00185 [Hankyongella ginsenosidimutans]|uniref:Uncharacterized protein n=1 Tax=Hankyongella ginsenosidimutans TaxID=1763828 RepID=A0A4D7C6K9_9SPHN|nr:hypothetical protein E6W36_00185 [Hankyongella ginsenosidimutans]
MPGCSIARSRNGGRMASRSASRGAAQSCRPAAVDRPVRPAVRPPARAGSAFVQQVALIGRATVAIVQNFGQFLDFVGMVLIRGGLLAANPQKMRWTAFSRHIEQTGFNALPIIGLMSFLIGLVIVQQGAYQLKRFGAGRSWST